MNKETDKKIMRDVFLAFVRVHVLYHAVKGRFFGVEMIEELKRHGYEISPGTLYPILHAWEESGVLISTKEVVGGKVRIYYWATKTGKLLLEKLQVKIVELVDEVMVPVERMLRASKTGK